MIRAELSHLYLTNLPPSPDESASIEADCQVIVKELQGLQIALNANRGVLSRMRCMPLEILGRIFSMVEYQRNISLGLVCKRWREATLLRHDLWNHFSARTVGFDKAVTWLSRSGTLPKSLHLYTSNKEYNCRPNACICKSASMVRLLTEGPTLDHLSIRPRSAGCFTRIIAALQEAPQDAPSRPWDTLRSLELEFEGGSTMEWEESVAETMFLQLPPVASLSIQLPHQITILDYSDIEAEHESLVISPGVLRNLTELSLRCNWGGLQTFDTLQDCPNLQTLELDADVSQMWPEYWEVPDPRVRLPNLRTMRLRRFHASFKLLAYIETPKLSELDIGLNDPSNDYPDCTDGPFSVLATRCSKTLESLTLYNASISPDILAEMVALYPNLTHLQLDNIKLDHRKFWRLIQSDTSDSDFTKVTYLPRLKHLEVLQVDPEDNPNIFEPIIDYLMRKGPHDIHVDVSFKRRYSAHAERTGWCVPSAWTSCFYLGYARQFWGDADSDAYSTPGRFGASFKVVPCVDDKILY